MYFNCQNKQNHLSIWFILTNWLCKRAHSIFRIKSGVSVYHNLCSEVAVNSQKIINKMFVAVTVVFAVLVTNCGSLSETEFSEIAGACGYSPSNPFTDRDDARHNEFPWSAQLFFTFGKSTEMPTSEKLWYWSRNFMRTGEGYRQNIYCEPTLTNGKTERDIHWTIY